MSLTQLLEQFDERFGKAGSEKNCDSIGKKAGCDDCYTNIIEREQHRVFIETVFLQGVEEGRKEQFKLDSE